jgi:hypothetical protein
MGGSYQPPGGGHISAAIRIASAAVLIGWMAPSVVCAQTDLQVGSVVARSGQSEVVVTLSADTTVDLTLLSVDLEFDAALCAQIVGPRLERAGATAQDPQEGGVSCPATGRGRARIALFDLSGATVVPRGQGPIAALVFGVRSDAPSRSFPLTLRLNEAADRTLTVPLTVGSGELDIVQPCVGDCNADGSVTIDELTRGVNVALGTQPTTQCGSLADSQGVVTIAQLIKSVNNALNGCQTQCQFGSSNNTSRIEISTAAFPQPLQFPLRGSATIDCSAPRADQTASCDCRIDSIEPITVVGLGVVCITPIGGCAAGRIDCDGGSALGVALRSDTNIGTCADNDQCRAQCSALCAQTGSAPLAAGCTGFCTGSADHHCVVDADCLPGDGNCNGPDPASINVCQCHCLNDAVGDPGRPGELQCNLGTRLVIENAAPCDGRDILLDAGSACIPLSTASVSSVILDANLEPGAQLPAGGPAMSQGAPIACSQLYEGTTSDLRIRGAVNFLGSSIGDLVTQVFMDCQ